MNLDDLITQITPEIFENLKTAVEIGKWPDGAKLSSEQLEHSMQAIIAYEEKNLVETQRTGYIDKSKKEGEQCDTPSDEQVVSVRKSSDRLN